MPSFCAVFRHPSNFMPNFVMPSSRRTICYYLAPLSPYPQSAPQRSPSVANAPPPYVPRIPRIISSVSALSPQCSTCHCMSWRCYGTAMGRPTAMVHSLMACFMARPMARPIAWSWHINHNVLCRPWVHHAHAMVKPWSCMARPR